MAGEDPEVFLRALAAPLKAARRGEPLPGTPFGREAVANAFVMLGLLPEPLAEEILSDYKPGLEAEGFRIGTLTGELSVRPGAHGFQDARAGGRDELTRIPLAAVAGPVPLALDGVDVRVTWVTLTPGGAETQPRHRAARREPDARIAAARRPGSWSVAPRCGSVRLVGDRRQEPQVPGPAGERTQQRPALVRAAGALVGGRDPGGAGAGAGAGAASGRD
jgi:hypothetical protein